MLLTNETCEGRKLLIRALVGSHNYNLNDESSDKDYKMFVCPNFNDLYSGTFVHANASSDTVDCVVYDIRDLGSLLYKSCVNFTEVLFSVSSDIFEDYDMQTIYQNKENIARMNLTRLYNTSMGTYHSRLKALRNGTSNNKNLIEEFGYDTKQAMTMYRSLDFLFRYACNGFTSFKQAIWYSDKQREELLSIKGGKRNLDEILKICSDMQTELDKNYKGLYAECATKYKEDSKYTLALLNICIKNIVKKHYLTSGVVKS